MVRTSGCTQAGRGPLLRSVSRCGDSWGGGSQTPGHGPEALPPEAAPRSSQIKHFTLRPASPRDLSPGDLGRVARQPAPLCV